MIQIKDPCLQDWNQMHDSVSGKFCSACHKNVFDLTGKTDEDIIELFIQQQGKLCGRIATKKPHWQNVAAQNHFKWFRSVSGKIIFGLFSFFGFGNMVSEADAQTINAANLDRQKLNALGIELSENESQVTGSLRVKGLIRDKETKEGIPFALVRIDLDGRQIGNGETDVEGNFEITIVAGHYSSIDIKAIYLGYEPVDIRNIPVSNLSLIKLALQPSFQTLGEVVITQGLIELPTKPDKTIGPKPYRKGDLNICPK